MNEYICTWGIPIIIITIIYLLILLFVFIQTYRYFIRKKEKLNNSFRYILLSISLIGLIISFSFLLESPLKITVQKDFININQVKGTLSISISDICEIRKYTDFDNKNSVRIFASGGVFGYIGKFKNPQIGTFRMYSTNVKDQFIIRTSKDTFVISCNNYESLIKEVELQRK